MKIPYWGQVCKFHGKTKKDFEQNKIDRYKVGIDIKYCTAKYEDKMIVIRRQFHYEADGESIICQ